MTGPAVLGSGLPWERPHGATPTGDGRTSFRTWAPRAQQVALEVDGRLQPMTDEGFGVHEVTVDVGHGADYRFVLDGEALPDPSSRWQPEGIRGPSRVVDPAAFAWTDEDWRGVDREHAVLYELHVGTFTAQGTFDAAIEHLAGLAELGVTAIEIMPVAEFPGARGWGYDGVFLSAAQSTYGGPEGLARLVDAAHAVGLGVVLDVVYNHLGASGVQAIEAFGPYLTDAHETFWGKAVNYDAEDCDPVREWVLQSAEGWIRDLHLDGLRLDAIHSIYDGSARPLVGEVSRRAHAAGEAAGREVLVVAESGLNDPKVIRPLDQNGLGCDAVWADDFHHAIRVLLTGEKEGYYAEFGALADLAKAFRRPVLPDGGYSTLRRKRFGAPHDDRPAHQFIVFDMNHDQVGNRAVGDRLPREIRPLAAFLTLLSPFTPMLFQGEEYGEDAPFLFFTDHIDEEIATATREGRRREFAGFAAFAGEEVPDPQAEDTFLRSKLTREGDPVLGALYRDLLRVRREIAPGDATLVEHDEDAGLLRVERGAHTIVANLGDAPVVVSVDGVEVVLETPGATEPTEAGVSLAPHAGILLR
ncbi:malto-oligosyltrehalose trehalohydrolase [Patulibacter sp.]|uniref:malto-oligosyltrehalose trehalohydrolase n=1 Tax=Patulibacter sp. TaxID=1912859 RepID=UPI002729006A|nr:malto-oligosyltrehalose trehalohydrolase [Patulibacter sp.]MDO9406860.1 malto-oligosyltrehalose trehalohydrolase [Patulibacter sp.]